MTGSGMAVAGAGFVTAAAAVGWQAIAALCALIAMILSMVIWLVRDSDRTERATKLISAFRGRLVKEIPEHKEN